MSRVIENHCDHSAGFWQFEGDLRCRACDINRGNILMAALHIAVGDMIEVPNHTGGTNLYYVVGSYLGGLGSDTLVELAPLTQAKGTDGPKPTNAMVPLRMIEAGVAAKAFTHSPG